MTNPVAGWYPDAEQPGGERWWDGTQWSDQRRTGSPAAPPPPPAAPAAAPPPAAPGYTAAPVDAAASSPGYTPAPAPAPGWGAPAYAAPGVQPAAAGQQNVLAIVGLSVAVASLIIGIYGAVPIAALVLSVLGYRRSAELGGRGRGLAIAGMIVAGVSLVFLIGGLVIRGF